MNRFSDRSRSVLRSSSDHLGGRDDIVAFSGRATVSTIYGFFHDGVPHALQKRSGPFGRHNTSPLPSLGRFMQLCPDCAAYVPLNGVANLPKARRGCPRKFPFRQEALKACTFAPRQSSNVFAFPTQPIWRRGCANGSAW
jgi:hypothetical protein